MSSGHDRSALRVPHDRRSIRLSGYDYARRGAYFVTINTRDGELLLGDIIHRRVRLSTVGQLARVCWLEIPEHFPWIRLDTFALMPNHLHGIIWICDDGPATKSGTATGTGIVDVGARHVVPLQTALPPVPTIPSFGYSQPHSLPRIVGTFKAAVTRKSGQPIWQRNYYEHIIRNEHTLGRIRRYIETNPARWDK